MNENSLKYVLQPGAVVYTKCFIDDEWLPNTIKEQKDNMVVLNLNDNFFKKGVMAGDYISIRFPYEENEYVLEGEIMDIDIYNNYSISIYINNMNIYKNRRKHFRYYAKLGSSLKTSQEEKGIYSIIINISLSGIGLISKSNINLGSRIYLDLFLSSKNILPVEGTITRKKALNYGYEYGISIISIPSENQEKYKRLIDELDNDLKNIK